MAAQSRLIQLAATGSAILFSGACTLRGFWVVTSGAATITLYDNTSAAGTVLAQWTTAGANADKAFDISDGVRCDNGLFIQVSAGSVTGNVRVG